MPGIKDVNWQTCIDAAATELSATFGSSDPGTNDTFAADGCVGVKFKLSDVSLPTATRIYVCPKFLDSDGNTTYAALADGSLDYVSVITANYETPIFWDIDAIAVGAEVWLDATDAAATCTLMIKRIYPKV